MFQDPQLDLFGCQDPVEEEHKISLSPLPHPSAFSKPPLPALSKKQSKKMAGESPKIRKNRGSEVPNPNQKFGHWGLSENKRYHWFL